MNKNDISDLEKNLEYRFADKELLCQALTHSSYINEKGLERAAGNERLEFLGDSLLGMAVSQLLFHHNPTFTEGEMSKIRARLVCEKSLSKLAIEIGLGSCLLLGHGEDSAGGRTRPSILADAYEAVIAAIYLDSDIEAVIRFVEKVFTPYISKTAGGNTDYKTMLQEFIQRSAGVHLVYTLLYEKGPDHNKTFTVKAEVNGAIKGIGTGKSKKAAEQAAAKKALSNLTESS